ncbi:hypothetical protein B0A89_13830 [Paracoccus contaminans]|uniref:Uncharacterized protein n=1 Tax=Paracoccus contaminans TaxID=1945662 RepID=A0A1W6D1F3_9RHOB|nr:hypothetical protein B0A89_13830 [Paracoccus contaminans]
MRVIVVLLAVALIALAGYAYFGDMRADPQHMRVPVQIDLGGLPAGAPAPAPAPAAPATPANDGAAAAGRDNAGAPGNQGGGTGNASLD